MAITIHQEPTSPGMANSDLLFTIDSNQKTQPQFQYVCDIYEATATYNSSSANYLQRIKQQPNPTGYGVFNVGQILVQYTDNDQPWTTTEFATSSFSQKDYVVRFGEQYGTSVSSSITTYNGVNTNPSENPFKSGSAYYSITNGLVNPYDAVDWNFASASYYTSSVSPTGGSANFNYQHGLSNAPVTQSIQDGEYATVSVYNGNFDDSSTNAQDIFVAQINVYNSAGANIQNFSYENLKSNGGGPRTSIAQEWSAVYSGQDEGSRLLHTGVGPQNFADAGNTLNANWAYYTVNFFGQEGAGIEDSTAVYASYKFTKDEANCQYPGVRFAWKNEFGTWDYFTFKLQSDSSSDIAREGYTRSFVNYSTDTNSVAYDKTRRGDTQFYNEITSKKTANTDWLTQAQADWLRELFYSADVYLQEDGEFRPAVITDANLVEKTNPRTQKTFQYRIQFQPANQPRPRQ